MDTIGYCIRLQGYRWDWWGSANSILKDDETLDLTSVAGFIVNVQNWWHGVVPLGRHWYTIREVDGIWYRLDSKKCDAYFFCVYRMIGKIQ